MIRELFTRRADGRAIPPLELTSAMMADAPALTPREAARVLAELRADKVRQARRAWHREYRERLGMAPDARLED